jgi:hypothetical protein
MMLLQGHKDHVLQSHKDQPHIDLFLSIPVSLEAKFKNMDQTYTWALLSSSTQKNIFSHDPHHKKCNSYDFVCAAKREFGKRVGALMKPTPAQLFI